MNLFLLIFIFLFSSFHAWTKSSIEERTIQITSATQKSSQILKKAQEEITYELILELLGEEQYKKLSRKIKNQIFPQSEKFILLSQILKVEEIDQSLRQELQKKFKKEKNSQKRPIPSLKDGEFIADILVKFSKDTLKKILIQEHLFYQEQGHNRITALIEFKDEINKQTYRWWDNSSTLDQYSLNFLKSVNQFYNNMQSSFMSYGFYMINPLMGQNQKMLPKDLHYSSVSSKTGVRLAQFFSSYLVMTGSITLSSLSRHNNQAVWDLSLYNTLHSRELASYKLRVKIPKNSWSFLHTSNQDWAKNMILQFLSIYEEGDLLSKLFIIELKGKLNFQDRKQIKESLINQAPDLKDLNEIFIDSKAIRYKVDANIDDKVLLKSIRGLQLAGFSFSSYIQSKNNIVIQVKKK